MSNKLINESSPYLLQHSENPVDWYPWGPEAFEKARAEDKPVFLSIGYSSCHWCHVMEKESFEDINVARILNRYFVSVKVDREERPDIDSVYMDVCSALTGSGGWPMSIIMTPEQEPFFAGTYIPRDNRPGQMGLMSLLMSVADMWQKNRAELLKTAGEVSRFIRSPQKSGSTVPDEAFLKSAAEQLYDSYDAEYGGFGTSPKFPAAHNLIFLLRYSKLSGDKKAREIAEHTMQQMYRGGIYDHIGGGFCRYSTDREWLAPHFEKTLYDNALLALCYTEAYQDGRLALYKQVAEDTLDYCLRELRSPQGGFYCSQDADSQGVEGKYYLFTPDEVKKTLGEDTGRHFCECYDILPEGNVHGKNIPNLLINQRWQMLPEGYDRLREKLRQYRPERCELFTDTKILTSWNGLMLTALARAARVFNSSRYLSAAVQLADFLIKKDGDPGFEHLTSCCTGGRCSIEANLDDYAFLALGLLELSQIYYAPGYLSAARALAVQITRHFPDPEGGYYLSSDRAEKLIKRPQEIYDGAMPSGNSGAALVFDRLFRLSAEPEWRDALDALLCRICSHSEKYPAGCTCALSALMSRVYPTKELLCASKDIPEALDTILSQYAPELSILVKNPENSAELAEFAPFTADIPIPEEKAALYICSGGRCDIPYMV